MDAVEQKILAAVDAQRETLLAFAQDIGAHAEPGFFETRTAARVAELLRGCGAEVTAGPGLSCFSGPAALALQEMGAVRAAAGFRRNPVWPAQA